MFQQIFTAYILEREVVLRITQNNAFTLDLGINHRLTVSVLLKILHVVRHVIIGVQDRNPLHAHGVDNKLTLDRIETTSLGINKVEHVQIVLFQLQRISLDRADTFALDANIGQLGIIIQILPQPVLDIVLKRQIPVNIVVVIRLLVFIPLTNITG
jgi:hypothetical protein